MNNDDGYPLPIHVQFLFDTRLFRLVDGLRKKDFSKVHCACLDFSDR